MNMAKLLFKLLSTAFHALGFILSPIFKLLFERKKGNIPAPQSPLVMKSACELADLIRSREVSLKLKYLPPENFESDNVYGFICFLRCDVRTL